MTGVTLATPGVARTAAASPAVPTTAPLDGSLAAMTSGASKPGPNPLAIVA